MAFDGSYKHENFMFSKIEILFLIPSLLSWSSTSLLGLEPFLFSLWSSFHLGLCTLPDPLTSPPAVSQVSIPSPSLLLLLL